MDAVSGVLSAATAEAIPRAYNFARDIFERNDSRRDRVAYIDQRGSWTYQQLRQRAEAFTQVLESLQVRPEERVLMCLLDSIDWPTVFLGTLHAGRVAIPVNTLMTEDDYRYMLEDSRARVLVVSQGALSEIRQPHWCGLRAQGDRLRPEPARSPVARGPAQRHSQRHRLSAATNHT